MHPQVQRVSTARYDGVEVELFIDHYAIMQLLGPRAAKSRGGKAQTMRGLILVKRKRPEKEPTAKNLERLFRL